MAKSKIRRESHPSFDIVRTYGSELSGRRIVLCVAGSVAAYKAIELARLMMRHGADVTCVASKAAMKLLRPDYLKWATGNNVITKLTGSLEHIRIAEKKTSDIVLVYPCTANTLGKLANGIDDDPIPTVLAVALGAKIPILVCPAMHASMYENIAVKRNVAFLKSNNIKFSQPDIIEGKAKVSEPSVILMQVMEMLGATKGLLCGKRVLVTVGGTSESIDTVRSITNQSSGEMGTRIITELLRAGAKVNAIYGETSYEPPEGVILSRIKSSVQMAKAVNTQLKIKKFDIVIMAAAVSDYTPKRQYDGKISSKKKSLVLRLEKTPKIIDGIKDIQKDTFLVGFKAESCVSIATLEKNAKVKLNSSKADMIVANDVGTVRYLKNPRSNEVIIVDCRGSKKSGYKSKEKIAAFIVKEIAKRI
ncbi:MAG: phosphopantothenoylcysteine decarboxylase/phosphopantothenate--cysteine ligase [Cenarchaeum symbiont of Oopsacas minuta]|nr:phosphopantothenoylcysteine decarboxylase/phosphopantothenate--cysteine ligase [Cenarchaeum symbiont of Oopsacas minuta]